MSAFFEHKVGNGLGDHQCAIDYLVFATRKESTGTLAHLVPVHEKLVSAGFSHPALAVIIEERNLRFEALHWSPVGVVMSRLGSCDLRPTPLHLDCAVLLTAARRCLESLTALNEAVVAAEAIGDWNPLVTRDKNSPVSC